MRGELHVRSPRADTLCHLIQLLLQILAGGISRRHISRKQGHRIPELSADPLQLSEFGLFQEGRNCRGLLDFRGIRNMDI